METQNGHLILRMIMLNFWGGPSQVRELSNGNYIRVGNTTTSNNNVLGFISCSDKKGKLIWNKFFLTQPLLIQKMLVVMVGILKLLSYKTEIYL